MSEATPRPAPTVPAAAPKPTAEPKPERRYSVYIILVLMPLLAGGFFSLNFYLGRPDRIAEGKRRDKMIFIADQLRRFESEHGALPNTLQELVPTYVLQEDLEDSEGPLYFYSAKERGIAEQRGGLIHGLFTYRMQPVEMQISEPDESSLKRPAMFDAPKPMDNAPSVSTPPVDTHSHSNPGPTPASNDPPPVPATVINFRPMPAPTLPDPPAGALVFEAEHFTDTNYGWEAHADPTVSGGAYLHCKEGIANGPAQKNYHVGNFYEVKGTREFTTLKYRFHIDKPGRYYCYARMWTTDTHCSNDLIATWDNDSAEGGTIDNREPFQWLWTPIDGAEKTFTAGDHYLHIFIHEDGIQLDQFIFSPKQISGHGAYKANFNPARGTAWEKEAGPALHVSFDTARAIISPAQTPDVRVVLRRLRLQEGAARLKVDLRHAGANGGDFPVMDAPFELSKLNELNFVGLDFKQLPLDKLPRREYELVARVELNGQEMAHASVVLMKPYTWETYGPGKVMFPNEAPGPLDVDAEPKADDPRKWAPFDEKCYEWFGVLDFGLLYDSNSKHGRTNSTVYCRTRIFVPKEGTYRFNVMSDDQMILWMDGEEIYRINDILPVTRSGRFFTRELKAGPHHLRMRINQREGPWQAYLRVRTEDDDLSDVRGLEIEPGK